MLKALLLIHGLDVGGAEVMVAQLARYLRGCGDAVEIGCLGELGRIGAALRDDGMAVHVYPRRPGIDATLPIRLARRVRAGGFDVVHLHQRTALFYGLLAGLGHRAPIVYTEHGPLGAPRAALRQRLFNQVLRRRLSGVSAVSADAARRLASGEGFAGARIAVIANGIDIARWAADPDRGAARARCGVTGAATIVGCVGRLHAVKNHAALVSMIAELRRRRDAVLVLIGDGPEEAALAALARRLGVAEAVRLLGMRHDVERLLPAFDVFCLPSRHEGVPLTLLEAMAAQVPVVAAATGGIPEAVRDEVEALLVPPERDGAARSDGGEASAWAAAVERLLDDPVLRQRLTVAARARVQAHFGVDAVCRAYRQLLAEVA